MAAERHEDAGLVVVGGSVAGLVAAITAADRGHRVVLLERSKELGGLAATWSESIAAGGTRFPRGPGVVDSPRRCPAVKDLPYLGAAGAKGDALSLAAPLGPALRHAATCSVTPFIAQPSHLALTRAIVDAGGMMVNQRGARFADETQASLPLALA